jgi:hypothetical protein
MNERYRWALLIFWMIAGTARAADQTTARPLYSLAPGTRWSYDETHETVQIFGSKTNVTHMTGTVDEEVFQAPAHYKEYGNTVLLRSTAKERREAEGGSSDVSGGYVQVFEWRRDDLYLHGVRVWIDGSYSEDMNLYQPPLSYLKGTARAGESWAVGKQKNMGAELSTTARMEGMETVTVPAGTFSNCLKVVYTSPKMSGAMGNSDGAPRIEDGNVQDTIWYMKDVGVVKEFQVSFITSATDQGRIFERQEQTKVLKSHMPAK